MKKRALIPFLVAILLVVSCKKTPLEDSNWAVEKTNSESLFERSQEELDVVLTDTNFISLVQIVEKIAIINDTLPHEITEEELPNLLEDVNAAESAQGVIDKLAEYGIQNTDSLQSLFNQIVPLLASLLERNEAFSELEEGPAIELLSESLDYYFSENPIYHWQDYDRGDICSQAYENAMDDCDANFTIATAVSVLTAAAVVFGSGGTAVVGAGFAVFSGIGAAYAAFYVCQRGAVRDWRLCRQQNPI